MNQCGRNVSLLTQHETQQIVCLGVILIEGKGLAELFRRGLQIAASDCFLPALTNRLPDSLRAELAFVSPRSAASRPSRVRSSLPAVQD